jgi:hypothetical protein
MIPNKKICGICLAEKDKECFQIRRKPNGHCWLRRECKTCQNDIRRYRYNKFPDVRQKHIDNNTKYYKKNIEYKKEYDKKREARIIEKRRIEKRNRYHEVEFKNIETRLKRSLRSRTYFALTKGQKCMKTMELVGCDISFLRKHIESLFIDGMSWNNYGVSGWHVDHILPCDSFDLTNHEEQKRCFHYTNLQPLWAIDNVLKSNKVAA